MIIHKTVSTYNRCLNTNIINVSVYFILPYLESKVNLRTLLWTASTQISLGK